MTLDGLPERVKHNASDWFDRDLVWERVPGAAMVQSRADDAGFAAIAGIPTGGLAVWEELYLYLNGPKGPFDDNRVYVMSTNDPATHVRTGPYAYHLTRSKPGLEGVPRDGARTDESSEFFDVTISLTAI